MVEYSCGNVNPKLEVCNMCEGKMLIGGQGSTPEPYKATPLTEEEWEKAKGIICPICGKETLRVYKTAWGENVCQQCFNEGICPHIRRSRYADILTAMGLRVCRLCRHLQRL